MSLPGSVATAPEGMLGFDTDTVITPDLAATFFGQGYRFCIRYVSRVATQGSSDLTVSEAIGILTAGLALFPVQHVRAPDWNPTADLGAADGVQAAHHALGL